MKFTGPRPDPSVELPLEEWAEVIYVLEKEINECAMRGRGFAEGTPERSMWGTRLLMIQAINNNIKSQFYPQEPQREANSNPGPG